MYARFLRWASDRLDENGVVAFVSNSSFINTKTYDGFRKCVAEEFNEIYVIDLKGDARTSGERRKQEAGNVFDDQIRVGIAVYFLVKKQDAKGCKIYYNAIDDYVESSEKLDYLQSNTLQTLSFETITPDINHNWIKLADNNFNDLLSVANKDTKDSKNQSQEQAIFKLFSLGVNTNRDEWVYGYCAKNLAAKMRYFIGRYNKNLGKKELDYEIKWSSSLVDHKAGKRKCAEFNDALIVETHFRPYFKQFHYIEKMLNHRLTDNHYVSYGRALTLKNPSISINTGNKDFNILASDGTMDLHFNGDTQFMPLYRYDESGNRTDNLTDWGLTQFITHYGELAKPITKLAIFHYVYAVLHDPVYREKYALNLKREFPRAPFYADFWAWTDWGSALMDAHIGYESAEPYALTRTDKKVAKPKAKLKADKENGLIILDEATTLSGFPAIAWHYKLGNRSALEWVLDQYKESKPKDPSIREKFNTYQFADYKEHVIDLLAKVCTVSMQTQTIVEAMKILNR